MVLGWAPRWVAQAPADTAVRAVGRFTVQAAAARYGLRATSLPFARRHLRRLGLYLATTNPVGAPWLVSTVEPAWCHAAP
ncbi:MAG: hypothetical protein VKQ33_10990 [Candidatus Sericytochromatia bacterium]|nr:hypothetical protein [Candidatus Sericytochromatia bacterium]